MDTEKQTRFVFLVGRVLAICIPSLALAWIAARSLQDQQLIVERQETLLCQVASDQIVQSILDQVSQEQASFARAVENLLTNSTPTQLGPVFSQRLRENWGLAELGFAVQLNGEVLNPLPWDGSAAKRFRLENDRFLCSRETVEVVWQSPKGKITLNKADDPPKSKSTDDKSVFATKGGVSAEPSSAGMPVQFREIVGTSQEGTLARFLQDQLVLLLWYRSLSDTNLVFGAQLKIPQLVARLRPALRPESPLENAFAVALRDDAGRVVALSKPNFQANWRHAFLSTEIGQVLPHWEVAMYLIDPGRLRHTAKTIQWTIGLLIAILLTAILAGSWLLAADFRRELVLARQKTDFVSNVSHELKTPLTSIRMFSEMLADGRVQDAANQQRFLKIISAEAARLTRLINNVLEFARRERGEEKYQFKSCDLREITERTVESYRPNLEGSGFVVHCDLPGEPVVITGDADSLAQVLLNLLSNAEKYSGEKKEIDVTLQTVAGQAELTICDRGLGVPSGVEEKIFEKFFRAHDSLASGVQGTGLGLTLARQIARAHSGDVTYTPRPGGGSCFTLRLKLSA